MKPLPRVREMLRQGAAGLTCDYCEKEIFRSPRRRLCKRCEEKMFKNDGLTCEKCGRAMPAEGVCLVCKEHPPHFQKAASPLIYFMDTAALVNRFKERDRFFAEYLAEEIWKILDRLELPEEPLIVAVPTTPSKLAERGYNPPEEIAKALAVRTGYEFAEGVLLKFGEGEQKHRSAKDRLEKIKRSIRVRKRKICQNRIILVVDDVMTTGATGSECARALKLIGAKDVYFVAACALPQKREE